MTDKNLSDLLEIESDLVSQLSKMPIFIQLESIRNTISTFKNGHSVKFEEKPPPQPTASALPYNSETFTWNEKVAWAIERMGSAAPAEIVKVLLPLETGTTKAWLDKRVSVMVSQMKKKGKLGVRKDGKKTKYFVIK